MVARSPGRVARPAAVSPATEQAPMYHTLGLDSSICRSIPGGTDQNPRRTPARNRLGQRLRVSQHQPDFTAERRVVALVNAIHQLNGPDDTAAGRPLAGLPLGADQHVQERAPEVVPAARRVDRDPHPDAGPPRPVLDALAPGDDGPSPGLPDGDGLHRVSVTVFGPSGSTITPANTVPSCVEESAQHREADGHPPPAGGGIIPALDFAGHGHVDQHRHQAPGRRRPRLHRVPRCDGLPRLDPQHRGRRAGARSRSSSARHWSSART